MIDFTLLQTRLDELISSDEFIKIAKEGNFTKENIQVINCPDYFVTLHDCKGLKPIYINDNQKKFYGFENNFFKNTDYLYYFTTVHPSKITSLVESLIHIRNGRDGYLNLDFRLKNNKGKYEYFIGSTKVFFINDEAVYALSVLQKSEKISPQKSKMLSGFSNITPREREITSLFVSGAQTKEIAEQLHLSEHTVKTHIKSIYKKFGVNNARELGMITDFLKFSDNTSSEN